MTHLTSLFVAGVPTMGVNGLPVPFTGQSWFVKPISGADGNDGMTPQTAFKTLSHAHTMATDNNNDVVYLIAEGSTIATTTAAQTATLTWSKNLTHLVGVCAPSMWSQRARISAASATTAASPLVDFTGAACYVSNIQIVQDQADAAALIAARVTGQRNVFSNVHFAGIANATIVGAGAMSLALAAAAENLFHHCTIGVDTIARDQNCTEMSCTSAATRNAFEDCTFDSYLSNAGFAAVTIAATNGIDRELIFKNCLFMAKSSNKSISQTSVFSIGAISQGAVILKGTTGFTDGGALVWDSNTRGIIWNDTVAPAATAGGGKMTNL